MSESIFFRIGREKPIQLAELTKALSGLLGMLRDFDAALSHDRYGTLNWEVTVLQKNSPAIVGVQPHPKRLSLPDIGQEVGSQMIESVRELTSTGTRSRFMSDAALLKMKPVAMKAKRLGPIAIYTARDVHQEEPTRIAEITQKTLGYIRDFTDAKFESYGSIVGNLEAISIHHGTETRVWDTRTGKSVRCHFGKGRLNEIKNYMNEPPTRVLVAGTIHSNISDFPVSIDLEEIEKVSASNVPTLEEITGLVDDFTEGRSLRDYMQEISDESD
ncbi:MAG TPA: hypothetical protein VNF74_02475 [Terriglobales bacterium]|nr:hypothetical protein [Terriglobales bacterium]